MLDHAGDDGMRCAVLLITNTIYVPGRRTGWGVDSDSVLTYLYSVGVRE